jgi:hypothetical protein
VTVAATGDLAWPPDRTLNRADGSKGDNDLVDAATSPAQVPQCGGDAQGGSGVAVQVRA